MLTSTDLEDITSIVKSMNPLIRISIVIFQTFVFMFIIYYYIVYTFTSLNFT